MGDDTSIRVSEELADTLWDLKQRGDSYEDVIWRLIEQAQSPAGDAAEREQRPPGAGDRPDPEAEADSASESGGASDPADPVVIPEAVRETVPGEGPTREARVAALREMAELLRREGTATKDEFLAELDLDEVGYASKDSFWSNCVKGRDTLAGIPGVQTPYTGGEEWWWDGP